jgi:predicted CopG family antitoxin
MATKTISLEMDAYEKLRRAKRTPSESFSSVVRRAVFPGQPSTGAELLASLRERLANGRAVISPRELDLLDDAQRSPRISDPERLPL